MPAKISDLDKERLLNAWKDGEDYQELARQLGIKRTTAWAIVNRANKRDGQVSLPRGGRRHHKIDDEIGDVLAAIVEEHPTFTLEQLKNELVVRLPDKPILSTTSVARCLTGRLIVLKKMEDAPHERNTTRVKDLRNAYARWLLGEGVAMELVYIDEAGINLWVRRTRGRARRGDRAVRVVGGQRGRNFTVTFAVSNRRGLVHHEIFDGGMTSVRFSAFLEATSRECHDQVTYVFDNAPCHARADHEPNNGGPQLPFNHFRQRLPPYSPFLNIVEMAISAFKASLKRQLEEVREQILREPQAQRLAILTQLAEQSTGVITAAKAAAWFSHAQRYLPKCIEREDILM